MTQADIGILTGGLVIAMLIWGCVSAAWPFLRGGGAPFIPMRKSLIRPLLMFADLRPGSVVYDLGCGDARLLAVATRHFGASKAVGYDISRWPLFLGRIRLRWMGLQDCTTLMCGDARTANVADADLIYLYLLRPLTNELASLIAPQVRSGTRLLCLSFSIDAEKNPAWRPMKQEQIQHMPAYLYERV